MILKSKFKPCVDLIFGMPGETPEDLEKTIVMIRELIKTGSEIRGHIFMPLPGTPWQNEKPGKIDIKLKSEIEKLIGCQKISGKWK